MGVKTGPGRLYFVDSKTGEKGELAEIQDVEVTSCLEDGLETLTKAFVKMGTTAATFTAAINRMTLLSLFIGRRVTNNWLKMHGGVMYRQYRKGRKKRNE